nr:hypothetical protein Cry52Nrm3_p159 [Cryptomonas curvata]
MTVNKNKKRSVLFRNLKCFKEKYTNIISKIIKLKNILQLNKNAVFAQSCKTILCKKLYSLGLLDNTEKINEKIITIITFKKRTIKFILFNKNFTESIQESITLIKKRKVYIGSNLILYPNLLIDREMEKKIIIVN